MTAKKAATWRNWKRRSSRQDAQEARKKVDAELKKLKLMSPMSAEATVVRNYIDTLINLPWTKKPRSSTTSSMLKRC